jgi:pyrroline-5-carboxylate reductase
MEEILGSGKKIIRVMPNTLVTVKRGFSALCCNKNITEEELDYVESLFKGIGDTVRIGEDIFDSFTGVSSILQYSKRGWHLREESPLLG